MPFLLLLMSSLQQNWIKGQNSFCLEAREMEWERQGMEGKGREMAETMYAYMNK
jgi:hypothetical protein